MQRDNANRSGDMRCGAAGSGSRRPVLVLGRPGARTAPPGRIKLAWSSNTGTVSTRPGREWIIRAAARDRSSFWTGDSDTFVFSSQPPEPEYPAQFRSVRSQFRSVRGKQR